MSNEELISVGERIWLSLKSKIKACQHRL
uniref:Uncharacterized protein n=1 Tax=Arundo donax TaxID=35708 RepID=A0A0A8ZBC5_ARUDO